MAFSAGQLEALAEIIANEVPFAMLLDVVPKELGDELAKTRKKSLSENSNGKLAVAKAVVEFYSKDVPLLVQELYRRLRLDDYVTSRLLPFCHDPAAVQVGAHQAALVRRARFMETRELRSFLNECEPRICVIAAGANGQTKFGTGFLVGADYVLTAYHTLERHIENGKQRAISPGPLFAFFDHLHGSPITDPHDPKIKARKVAFAAQWLIFCREMLDKDGEFQTPSAEQMTLLPQRLDFVVVKLAEQIGLESYAPTGGARRSWFAVQPPQLKMSGALERRIIIPQHPDAWPQQVDFGRLRAFDDSGTRLRYDTETDPGTSGAPCFNEKYELVGMHNAAYKPNGVAELNQAVCIQAITDALKAATHVELSKNHPTDEKTSRLWGIFAGKESAEVILGRDTLLEWIVRAAKPNPSEKADRIYAAVGELANSGRQFSAKIIAAARRSTNDPIVELGSREIAIPKTVGAVVRTIADQLQISDTLLADMPEAPTIALPSNAGDGDKLRKWASDDMPRWFAGVLQKAREPLVGSEELAQAKARLAGVLQISVEKLTELLGNDIAQGNGQAASVKLTRWETVWIALRIADGEMSEEVRDFVAGLAGASVDEQQVPPELRRLRWVISGAVPDFIVGRATVEKLDPLRIGLEEMMTCVQGIADSVGMVLSDKQAPIVRALFRAMLNNSDAGLATTRLLYMQRVLGDVALTLRDEVKAQ